MKIEVYDEGKKEEKLVRLRLMIREGSVRLIAVNSKGDPLPSGMLLVFSTDGTISRCGGVNPELGFVLDKNGGIVVS